MVSKPKKTIQDLTYEVVCSSLGDLSGKRILDVGAGSGMLSQRMAEAGAEVSALDLEKPKHLTHPNATFVGHNLGDGTLPCDSKAFDCVVSTEVIEHMKAPFVLLHSMVRVLRPGGVLVLTMPNYWNLKYRIRYLLTGNVQSPPSTDRWRELYLNGYGPHINVLTWPTLRMVLTWEGCEGFHVDSARTFRLPRRLLYLPLISLVRLNKLFTGSRRAREMHLDETGSARVLMGARQILIQCRRGGLPQEGEPPGGNGR